MHVVRDGFRVMTRCVRGAIIFWLGCSIRSLD